MKGSSMESDTDSPVGTEVHRRLTNIKVTTVALVVVVIVNVVLAAAYLWDASHEARENQADLIAICEGVNAARAQAVEDDNIFRSGVGQALIAWASGDGSIDAQDERVLGFFEEALKPRVFEPEACPPEPRR